jgi:hypothetical protein
VEDDMRELDQPAQIVTRENFYQGHIKALNEQLYNAYKRINELQQELKKERENHGKD